MRARLRALWSLLISEHRAPARVALAVCLGCVIGCTPLFGLHLPLCVLLALLLRLNKLIVYGAANISIPPLVPLLGGVSVELGERALHGRWMRLSTADFHGPALAATARRFFSAWMVGGLLLGAAIGALAGAVIYALLRRRPHGDPPVDLPVDLVDQALQRAQRRYQGLHPRYAIYARMKYRMDPCYRAVARRVPAGARLCDLGTGLGMLPVLLGELGGERRAVGIEWDPAKLACGRHAARGLEGQVELRPGDVRDEPLPPSDVIALVDVLHYYDPPQQEAIIDRARAALSPGGALLIRETDGDLRGGAAWTRAVEWLMVKLRWNRGPGVRFCSIAALEALLRGRGMAVQREAVAGPAHPGNVLLVARADPP